MPNLVTLYLTFKVREAQNSIKPFQFQTGGRSAKPRSTVNLGPPTFIKETVFSSEIHSIEYRDNGSGLASSPIRRTNLIYETEIGGSEVVFDDIGEVVVEQTSPEGSAAVSCDVNVTYDLLQGEFPPPSLGGLSVKIEEDDLLSQDPLGTAGVEQSLDNLCLGAEANYEAPVAAAIQDKSNDQPVTSSRMIGGITIAEYDGSPRRYRPRGSNETASNASSTSDVSKASGSGGGANVNVNSGTKISPVARAGRSGLRMPGFPQRVLPPSEPAASVASVASLSVNSSPISTLKEKQIEVEEEELLKFDDIPPNVTSGDVKKPTSSKADADVATQVSRKNVADDFDLRYEFSETRKVLEEFFQTSQLSAKTDEELDKDFNDLEYTLRRRSPLPHEQGKGILFESKGCFISLVELVYKFHRNVNMGHPRAV